MSICTIYTIDQRNTKLNISDFQRWPAGIYTEKVAAGNDLFMRK